MDQIEKTAEIEDTEAVEKSTKKKAKTSRPELLQSHGGRPALNNTAAKFTPFNSSKRLGKGSARGR